ncbi:carbohydrate-binding module family 13 protein [Moniliophthora roreri MCA 2997]|uniref:Carbohydrate-binding module family 13 protein n=2 Tax=Moniliophthora roreri TaxID=221103 RepID=V2WRD4_MONRO|nr:carbohydrate-binding module family 13 protein [Moniliophthora roreri MCA 2997]KAI3597797.1 carbohydrate-binding module family 13 protein [Moniliophthora roreri]
MAPEAGKTYHIINLKTGNALDLADDGRVTGYELHGGENQRWRVEHDGNHFTLQTDKGPYLSRWSEDEGTPVVGSNDSCYWDIWPDRNNGSVFRLYVPGAPTPMNIDLSDHGNPANGTPVTLWTEWEGEHQAWKFEEC